MSVAGVIVTHGPDPELPRAVAALGPQVDELVVVANPPAPETDASLIVNEDALGFAANVNKGVAATSAPYVVVANPDTEPDPDAVAHLAGLRRDPSARRDHRAEARLPGRPTPVVAPAIPDRLGHDRPPHAAPPLALRHAAGSLRVGRASLRPDRGRLAARRLPPVAARHARRARRLRRGLPPVRRGHRHRVPRREGRLGALVRAGSGRPTRAPGRHRQAVPDAPHPVALARDPALRPQAPQSSWCRSPRVRRYEPLSARRSSRRSGCPTA